MRAVSAISVALCLLVGSAEAANPHFVAANLYLNQDGRLVCDWKETGLGRSIDDGVEYLCGALSVAIAYGCTASDATHVAEYSETTIGATFYANGEITQTLVAPQPEFSNDLPGRARAAALVSFIRSCRIYDGELFVDGVQWCAAYLDDVTNGVVGASSSGLTQGSISPCE